MPTYIIPVTYKMYGKYAVEADCIEDAIDKVLNGNVPGLPISNDYLDDSIRCFPEDVVENNTLTSDEVYAVEEMIEEFYRQKFG